MFVVRRILATVLALLLVAAGTPDLVHAEPVQALVATHAHADQEAPTDHDHVTSRCAAACQVAPAVIPVVEVPRRRAPVRFALPPQTVAPLSEPPLLEPYPPRRTR